MYFKISNSRIIGSYRKKSLHLFFNTQFPASRLEGIQTHHAVNRMDHSRKFLQWQAFKTLLKTEELGNMIEAKAKQVQLFISEYSEKTRNSRPPESALLIGINENFSLTNFLLCSNHHFSTNGIAPPPPIPTDTTNSIRSDEGLTLEMWLNLISIREFAGFVNIRRWYMKLRYYKG